MENDDNLDSDLVRPEDAAVDDRDAVAGSGDTRRATGRSADREVGRSVSRDADRDAALERDRIADVDADADAGLRSVSSDVVGEDKPLGEEVGEAAGGISGVLTGAAIGSAGGPVGTVIGAIAGAVGGWWAGRAISEAAARLTHADAAADEGYYRAHYEGSADRPADRSYDDVRPAYQIGHLAGQNPDYRGRSFDEVERDLQRGWTDDVSARHGSWDSVRHYARDAFTRGRDRLQTAGQARPGTGDLGTAQGRTTDDAAAGAQVPVDARVAQSATEVAEIRDAGAGDRVRDRMGDDWGDRQGHGEVF